MTNFNHDRSPTNHAATDGSRLSETVLSGEVVLVREPQIAIPAVPSARPPRRRRVAMPLFLFLMTCFTTYSAGCYHWREQFFGEPTLVDAQSGETYEDHRSVELTAQEDGLVLVNCFTALRRNWRDGLVYMFGVIGILLFHEMGHFLMTLRYKVPASFPFFIPMPLVMITGTMGAVIAMDGRKADRKQLFDIGIAGPLAGLVLAIPITVVGILQADVIVPQAHQGGFGDPLIIRLAAPLLVDMKPGQELQVNACLMAGWFGLLITGVNMMPVSQLDGGHVIHGLFGRNARWIARGFVVTAVALMLAFSVYQWIPMLFIVVFLIGVVHPPSADDRVDIGAFRKALGIASLTIPVFCFPPILFIR